MTEDGGAKVEAPKDIRCDLCGEILEQGASDETTIHVKPCNHLGIGVDKFSVACAPAPTPAPTIDELLAQAEATMTPAQFEECVKANAAAIDHTRQIVYKRVGTPAPSESADAPEQAIASAWDKYWDSLPLDEQEKLGPNIGGARAWFGIGEVWGSAPLRVEISQLRKALASRSVPGTPHGALWLCYHALKSCEWQNINGFSHPCPYCGFAFSPGHDKDCMIGNALKWMSESVESGVPGTVEEEREK